MESSVGCDCLVGCVPTDGMNETSKSPGRSSGVRFWMGYAVASVGSFILVFGLRLLDDDPVDADPGFWLNALLMCIALGVVALLAGLIFQTAHDLLLAVWRGQFRFWHFAFLLVIVAACLAVGYINYLYGGGPMRWFLW